jgi:hypothetical protein
LQIPLEGGVGGDSHTCVPCWCWLG